MIPAEAVERFRADLEQLTGGDPARIGVAVSGGPDSLALLLLAAAAYPRRVAAATVDHNLRREGTAEAELVAGLAAARGIDHTILTIQWSAPPQSNLQAEARGQRYRLLKQWLRDIACSSVLLTAHHADDQAETLLMRLARGAGVRGLSGIRPVRREDGIAICRPLLGWRRQELADLVTAQRIEAVDDPSNRDLRFDRTGVRAFIGQQSFLDPQKLANSAGAIGEADAALDWTAERLAGAHLQTAAGRTMLCADGLPAELQRRLTLRAIGIVLPDREPPRGDDVTRLLKRLRAGDRSELGGVLCSGGDRVWTFERAPPRKS